MSEPFPPLRPRDFAALILAGDTPPRSRARDQQADRAGLQLKSRLLQEIIALDPDPGMLEAALLAIVERFGPPFGPTRSLARILLDEWCMACMAPTWIDHLFDTAMQPIQSRQTQETRHGRQLPG